MLLGETSLLSDDAATQGPFLAGAAPDLAGAFEFFDGRDPRTIQARSLYDAVYQASLKQFIALRPQLVAHSDDTAPRSAEHSAPQTPQWDWSA
jgi:hypothetical protein